MLDDFAHIAFISPNAAFSAFAESVLGSWPDIKVHAFETNEEFAAAGLVPHVIACNFEFADNFYDELAPLLKRMRLRADVATLAIVRTVDQTSRARCRALGIDEVAVKPISPLHLGLRLAAMTRDPGLGARPTSSAQIVPFPEHRTRRPADGSRPIAF